MPPSEEASTTSDAASEREPYSLLDFEEYWRDRYHWLLEKGYQLRSRYHPEWVPSWKTDTKLWAGLTEDSQLPRYPALIDAIRLEDQSQAILKLVKKSNSPHEIDILKYFSEEPQRSDPRNHCIQLIDSFPSRDDEDSTIAVLPVLRPYDDPEFDTIGEGLDFIVQILEGFAFMHEHRVAHRDIRSENIMLDGRKLYPSGFFHPWVLDMKWDHSGPAIPRYTRTESPSRYYLIDFGFSKQYAEDEMPPSEYPKVASDPSVPEFKHLSSPSNPLLIDVYTVGNLIRMDFMDGNPISVEYHGRRGFEFLRPLVDAMTDQDPNKRPSMRQAITIFEDIVKDVSSWKLRSRAVRIPGGIIDESDWSRKAHENVVHWYKRATYVARRLPPIPKVSELEDGSKSKKATTSQSAPLTKDSTKIKASTKATSEDETEAAATGMENQDAKAGHTT